MYRTPIQYDTFLFSVEIAMFLSVAVGVIVKITRNFPKNLGIFPLS